MERCLDLDAARWIREGCVPLPAYGGRGTWRLRCHHVIPGGFGAYVKVFHPLFDDPSVQDRRRSWDEAERDDAEAPLSTAMASEPSQDAARVLGELLRSSTLRSVNPPAEQGALVPLRWSELVKTLGIPYAPALSVHDLAPSFRGGSFPSWLYGPAEGDLGWPLFDALSRRLEAGGETGTINALRDLIVNPSEGDVFLRGSLDDLRDQQRAGQRKSSPTWWWPEHRTWCVASDWDLTFTIVGGPARLLDAIGRDAAIESMPVAHDDVVLQC